MHQESPQDGPFRTFHVPGVTVICALVLTALAMFVGIGLFITGCLGVPLEGLTQILLALVLTSLGVFTFWQLVRTLD
jgi:hypothetical protein